MFKFFQEIPMTQSGKKLGIFHIAYERKNMKNSASKRKMNAYTNISLQNSDMAVRFIDHGRCHCVRDRIYNIAYTILSSLLLSLFYRDILDACVSTVMT